jgi:hypothetical protein
MTLEYLQRESLGIVRRPLPILVNDEVCYEYRVVKNAGRREEWPTRRLLERRRGRRRECCDKRYRPQEVLRTRI